LREACQLFVAHRERRAGRVEDDEGDVTKPNSSAVVPGILGKLGWTWNVLIVSVVLVAVAAIVTFVRR
jgi:hypothetical protein